MFVVIYNPGAAGKMVSAVIDNVDCFESDITPTIEPIIGSPRHKLMSGADSWPEYHNFPLLKKVVEENLYRSISNHCSNYFLRHFDLDNLIFIDDSDSAINTWSLARAHEIFPHVHEITPKKLSDRTDLHNNIKLYGRKVIHMNDIMNGNLINVLKKWIDTPLNEHIYTAWLQKQKLDTYPFDLTNTVK
jgi:hypothetical protein